MPSATQLWLRIAQYGSRPRCAYCLTPIYPAGLIKLLGLSEGRMATLDHIRPKSRGGRDKGNTALCCKRCNNKLGASDQSEHLVALCLEGDIIVKLRRKSWHK